MQIRIFRETDRQTEIEAVTLRASLSGTFKDVVNQCLEFERQSDRQADSQ